MKQSFKDLQSVCYSQVEAKFSTIFEFQTIVLKITFFLNCVTVESIESVSLANAIVKGSTTTTTTNSMNNVMMSWAYCDFWITAI